jgi:tricarballylate dehydrogenase
MESDFDVVVVGGGNAALCAALAAAEAGARVQVLERAPHGAHGGNSMFTAGAMRFAYRHADDIRVLVPDLSPDLAGRTNFGHYPEEQFYADLAGVTENHADPELADKLVSSSFGTLLWMRDNGVRFLPIYGRQAYEVDGRFTFWGGLTLEVSGGGPGLVEALSRRCKKVGVAIEYGTRVVSLRRSGGRVRAVVMWQNNVEKEVPAKAVVLACGGFQANPAWRAQYLGPGWDLAKVRGTRFNTGDGIRMAIDVGAAAWGQWSGAHAVAWEYNAPVFGDLSVGDGFQKHSYPLGIMVNLLGERFLDEGADFRNYTYAKYGAVILRQPAQMAWQVFDAKVSALLRDEYRIRQVTRVTAESIDRLGAKMEGIDADAFVATVARYNAAITADIPFSPNVKDGRRTLGLAVNKSNWANTLDTPPFEAYAVTCGITFTFGGLHISTSAQVLDEEDEPIAGLFAAGELVGGLFYFNYPGGSGLTNGAVFGRIAGAEAAAAAAALR